MNGEQYGRLIYLVLLLAAIGGWVFAEYRGRMGAALRTFLVWGMIFVGLMAGYGLWQDIRTDLNPRQNIIANRIEVPRSADGHYYLTLMINNTPVAFMVDTGASNVVLSQNDARRLEIDPARLVYLGTASTANGTVRTAQVTLDHVALGNVTDDGLRASVNDAEMDNSLLGMDYLGRFHIEITGNKMILTR